MCMCILRTITVLADNICHSFTPPGTVRNYCGTMKPPYSIQRQQAEGHLPALIPIEDGDRIVQVHGFSERANW